MKQREMLEARADVMLPSRDEARSLTYESLQRGITLTPLISAAAKVSQYVDEAIDIVVDEYKPKLACQKGCWYCCCMPQIFITIPELFRIVAFARETLSAGDLDALRQRARDYAARVNGRSLREMAKEPAFPCALLVDDCCSVYEARPLTCRAFNSLDVDACKEDYKTGDGRIPIFMLAKDAADAALTGEAEALVEAGSNGALVDLGLALDVALTYGPGFEEAVIAGAPLLSPLEDRNTTVSRLREIKRIARQVGVTF